MMRYYSIRVIAEAVICAAIMFATAAFADGPADCKNISTDKGKVSGVLVEKSGLCLYKGIPFAAPPVGDLRFARPQEHAQWQETLAADKFGNMCLQNAMSLFPSDKIVGDEDCLYLNVLQPVGAAKEKKPVMVFFHGGGFVYGAGSEDLYQGTGLSQLGDVITVTVNYRLGAFGFIVHPSLKDSDGFEGNYGIWDQIASLKWVKKNISSFGGDPDNVTIFGESAGGMSVGLHLLAPQSKGLYKNAIIESGPVIILDKNLREAEKTGISAAEKLGCNDAKTAAACLRKIAAFDIMKGAPAGMFFIADNEANNSFPYAPVADGKLIADYPYKMYKRGEFNKDVKIMLGSNSDEATYFILSRKLDTPEDYDKTIAQDVAMMQKAIGINVDVSRLKALYPLSDYKNPRKAYTDLFTDMAFTCTTRINADMISKYKKNGIFLYFFSKKPVESGPFKEWGAFHGSELAFVFNKFEFMGIKFGSKTNTEMAKKMSPLWASYARTGVPSLDGVSAWPEFSSSAPAYMHLNLDMKAESNLRDAKCAYFGEIFENMFAVKK